MSRNTPSSTECFVASQVEGRFSGFGLCREILGVGRYKIWRADGRSLTSSGASVQIVIAPPKCDEFLTVAIYVCPTHDLCTPDCCPHGCNAQMERSLGQVPRYMTTVVFCRGDGFELTTWERLPASGSEIAKDVIPCDVDYYITIATPRDGSNLAPCSLAE